jgi:hypothetical protein
MLLHRSTIRGMKRYASGMLPDCDRSGFESSHWPNQRVVHAAGLRRAWPNSILSSAVQFDCIQTCGMGASALRNDRVENQQAACRYGQLRHVDDDFAEVRSRSHVLVRRVNLVEAEHFVDHWLDPVRCNGAVHRLEHLHRADRNALHVGAAS